MAFHFLQHDENGQILLSIIPSPSELPTINGLTVTRGINLRFFVTSCGVFIALNEQIWCCKFTLIYYHFRNQMCLLCSGMVIHTDNRTLTHTWVCMWCTCVYHVYLCVLPFVVLWLCTVLSICCMAVWLKGNVYIYEGNKQITQIFFSSLARSSTNTFNRGVWE